MNKIAILKKDLLNNPCASLIIAALEIERAYLWLLIPDWVHCLANGNPTHWEEVIKAAISFLNAEEMK